VVPHGGPHSSFTTAFTAPYAFLALHLNAVVLLVNYRGSTGEWWWLSKVELKLCLIKYLMFFIFVALNVDSTLTTISRVYSVSQFNLFLFLAGFGSSSVSSLLGTIGTNDVADVLLATRDVIQKSKGEWQCLLELQFEV
jgi:hypothetical protein